MIQAASLIYGQLDHLLGTWSQTDLAQDNAVSAANNKFNGATNLVQLHAEVT